MESIPVGTEDGGEVAQGGPETGNLEQDASSETQNLDEEEYDFGPYVKGEYDFGEYSTTVEEYMINKYRDGNNKQPSEEQNSTAKDLARPIDEHKYDFPYNTQKPEAEPERVARRAFELGGTVYTIDLDTADQQKLQELLGALAPLLDKAVPAKGPRRWPRRSR